MERSYLEEIATALENAGYNTFLPHRDVGLLDSIDDVNREHIFRADMTALDDCDICVALLTGPDHDSGTSAEIGYMYAKGKPCFGITDDMRWMNNLIWGLCNSGNNICTSIETCIQLLKTQISQ
ncbi:MAG: nucleoside 2-deoxyribosyltransferase [Anaerolineaceae bacterium]|nr:nucleoside 2-deoxyribosyltransferase [Anaerolineaceae bacterium]